LDEIFAELQKDVWAMVLKIIQVISLYFILPVAALLILAWVLKIRGSPFRFVVMVSTVIGVLIFAIYGLPKLTE
jgi:hypothetical protein